MSEQSEQKLSERTVKINGIEHTMMLSDEDAKRYDAAEETYQAAQSGGAETKASKASANKARSAEDK